MTYQDTVAQMQRDIDRDIDQVRNEIDQVRREAVELIRLKRQHEAERRGTLTPSVLALETARQIANDRRFYIDDEEMIESHAAIIERALQQEKTA